MLDELLQQKYRLEAEMQASAQDDTIRAKYFDVLNRIVSSHFGPFFACFPEVKTPLLLRGGSSDIWNLKQVFYDRQYAMELPSEPERILDLGAYAGYTAVFFANQFPNADIISVEPEGSNFQTLASNTAAYPNIRCLQAGVWHQRTELAVAEYFYGDWGTGFKENLNGPAQKTIPAYPITHILQIHDWDEVDFIKCSSHAGRIDVLLRPRPSWLEKARVIITRPGAGGWHAGDLEQIGAALPEGEFERRSYGPLLVFNRRFEDTPTSERFPAALHLIPKSPQRLRFTVSNVNEKLNFYRFGDAGIQLTPNPPMSPVAAFRAEIALAGHSRFCVRLRTADASPGRVKFTVQIRNAKTDAIVVDASHTLSVNALFDWDLAFAPAWGVHAVLLATETLTSTSDTEAEARRPSHFIDPKLA